MADVALLYISKALSVILLAEDPTAFQPPYSCTNDSVILPTAVSFALLSNFFSIIPNIVLSHQFSNCATLLWSTDKPSSAPRSMIIAPRLTNPFGILIIPEPTPDIIDSVIPTSLSNGTPADSVNINPPVPGSSVVNLKGSSLSLSPA